MLLFDLTLPSIEEDLALDEAALARVEEGQVPPHVRVWEPTRPAVVLGASGRIADDVCVEACEEDGVPIVRRSSGGGTVVVGPGALNFTVVLRRDALPGLDAVDRAQGVALGRLADALGGEACGLTVRGSGDLCLGSRKVAGSAQRRLKDNLLVHATILYDFDLGRITRYLRPPTRQPSYRVGRTHDAFVTNLGVSRAALVEALTRAWDGISSTFLPLAPALASVPRLVSGKFADPAWVWRL